MNFTQPILTTSAGASNTGQAADSFESHVASGRTNDFFPRLRDKIVGWFRNETRTKSILRNQTNLPAFLLIALGVSLLCNFTLRQSSAEASRPVGTRASIERVLNLMRQNPDDYELHSQLGELYYRDRKYRRAMFHLAEANRLIERFGD